MAASVKVIGASDSLRWHRTAGLQGQASGERVTGVLSGRLLGGVYYLAREDSRSEPQTRSVTCPEYSPIAATTYLSAFRPESSPLDMRQEDLRCKI